MANLMSRLFSGGTGERDVARLLGRLDKEKTLVRLEVEQAQVRFRTVLSVKRGMVVVAKPMGLATGILKKEGFVRFVNPHDTSQGVRLQVLSPHFNLSSGNSVFLCKLPTAFVKGSLRTSERFSTARFNGLALVLPARQAQFRVMDLSMSGCRFALGKGFSERDFPIGKTLSDLYINLGKVKVNLKVYIPRVHISASVGGQMTVESDGSSQKYLAHLLASLEKEEDEKLVASSTA